ncbi:MAG TPA: hypothetical protein VJR58_07210 [Vineibacter sp.]|nr:hypothetical protein [Vineibacter sp.]
MATSNCERLLSCEDLALPRERFRERLLERITRALDRQESMAPAPAAMLDHLLVASDAARLEDYIDVILTACGTVLDERSMPCGIEIT